MPDTQIAPHACEFPCQPPEGSPLAPGDCLVCGKTYALDVAQKRAAEAGMVLVDPEDLRWELGLETLTIMTAARARAAHDRLVAVAARVKP
jgi:hypothetical protein